MKAEIRPREPIHYRGESAELREAEDSYAYLLVLDDVDYEHDHPDDGGHGFPCRRDQLVELRDAINRVLESA